MVETLISFLENTLIPLGVVGIFLAAAIESVLVPIPSALVLYSSGFVFLSSLSGVEFYRDLLFVVAIPAALGATIGSFVIYGLGFFLGKPFFLRWGSWVGISWEDIERLQKQFSKGPRDEVTMALLRAIPVIPASALSALAGVVRMGILSYAVSTFIGSVIRGFILAWIGGEMGGLYESHMEFIQKWENTFLLLALIGALLGLLFFVRRKKKTRDTMHI